MGIHDRDYMRDDLGSGGGSRGLGGANPMIVLWALIGACVFFQLLPLTGWGTVTYPSGARASLVAQKLGVSVNTLMQGEVWRLFTYQFIHGNLLHLGANMLMLFFLGREVIRRAGAAHLLAIFLIGGAIGALCELVINAMTDIGNRPLIGASGSVSALLGYFAMLMPNLRIGVLLFFIIPIRGPILRLAWGWVIFNLALAILTLFVPSLNVAWVAHAGGTLYGFLHARMLGDRPFAALFAKKPRDSGPDLRYQPRPGSTKIIDAEFSDPQQQADYDAILDKINREGIASLTPEERRILEEASQRMRGDT